MSDYEIFAILLRVIELVLIANLYKKHKKTIAKALQKNGRLFINVLFWSVTVYRFALCIFILPLSLPLFQAFCQSFIQRKQSPT